MKYIIYLILLLSSFSFTSVKCQILYKKGYDTSLNGRFTLGELDSGTLFMELTRGFNKLDSYGNIAFREIYAGGLLTINFIKNSGSTINFDGTYNDTCGVNMSLKPCIGMMDTNGVITRINVYRLNGRCNNFITHAKVCSDGGTVAIGKRDQTFTSGLEDHTFVFKSDSTGTLAWAKYFNNIDGGGACIQELHDSSYVAGCNLYNFGACVIRLDLNGNIIWSKSIIRPRGIISDMLVNPDGTIMICGLTDSSANRRLFLIKMDTSGSVLWGKSFDGTDPYNFINGHPHMLVTKDSAYVLLAGKLSELYNSNSLIFIKLNTNGDTVYTNSIGWPGYSMEPLNLFNTSSNEYLTSGVVYGNFGLITGLLFVYKTDSLFNTECANYSEPIITGLIFPTDSSISLTTVDGGYDYNAPVTTMNLGPTPTFDECIYTKIDNDKFNRNITIFPNPSFGHFTLDLEGPLSSDCWFSVYNPLGVLILQRTMYSEKNKIEIDLSSFGKGIYWIEFTEKDQVSVKKVVIQ